jgi:hypothetical protein
MSSAKEIGPGQEVLSYCGKCKLALVHVIISMNKKGNIDKCECKTCGATHKYRDPEKAAKKRSATPRAPKKASASPADKWDKAVSDAKGIALPYEMSGEFSEGNIIDHPTFGKGVVEENIPPNKIKVIFEEGAKILIHKLNPDR